MEIKNNKFWNTFPKNPTQTKYFRFIKTPQAEIKTEFTESLDKLDKLQKDMSKLPKTIYSEFLE